MPQLAKNNKIARKNGAKYGVKFKTKFKVEVVEGYSNNFVG